MPIRTFAVCILIVAASLGCQKAQAHPPAQVSLHYDNQHNEKAFLKYIWPALKAAGKPAIVYYPAICGSQYYNDIEFPEIHIRPPSKSKTGLAAIRDVLRNDNRVTVRENKRGVIQIRIGNVPDAILSTNISVLTLAPEDQYNPYLAISDIEKTREVQVAMRNLRIGILPRTYNVPVILPAEGFIHLPASITNVTMGESLETVAATFKGVVLYGVCTRQNLFDISFTGGIYFNDRWLDTEDNPK